MGAVALRALADQAMRETMRTITAPDGSRRILIERHASGFDSFEEQYFSDDPLEMCWCPLSPSSFAMCDSAETAEREARQRVSWLPADAGDPSSDVD